MDETFADDVSDTSDADGDTDLPGGRSTKKKSKQISVRQFYAYRLHQRHNMGKEECLFHAQRLFQEYCCMAFAKQEMQRLRYIQRNQDKILTDLYQNLVDTVRAHDQNPNAGELRAGKPVVLPSSFTGGPRDMFARYQDAMAVVRKHGKPSFFVTMTCNPKWPEIQKSLVAGQRAEDRPDLVARVFKLKLDAMLDEIYKGGIFGRVRAHLHVVEFQKRGLPHAHILVILEQHDRLVSADDIDAIISAELPEAPAESDFADAAEYERAKEAFDRLDKRVKESMVHRECGEHNPNAPCMHKFGNKCDKGFPKKFVPYTKMNEKEIYPEYRRLTPGQGGVTTDVEVTTKRGKSRVRVIDNRWVVPYNKYLLLRYDCHINVEVCLSVESVKYLYKYVYKGPDRTPYNAPGRTEKTPCV